MDFPSATELRAHVIEQIGQRHIPMSPVGRQTLNGFKFTVLINYLIKRGESIWNERGPNALVEALDRNLELLASPWNNPHIIANNILDRYVLTLPRQETVPEAGCPAHASRDDDGDSEPEGESAPSGGDSAPAEADGDGDGKPKGESEGEGEGQEQSPDQDEPSSDGTPGEDGQPDGNPEGGTDDGSEDEGDSKPGMPPLEQPEESDSDGDGDGSEEESEDGASQSEDRPPKKRRHDRAGKRARREAREREQAQSQEGPQGESEGESQGESEGIPQEVPQEKPATTPKDEDMMEHYMQPKVDALVSMGKPVYLYGDPGTGKTMMALIAARKAGLKVYMASAPQEIYQVIGSQNIQGEPIRSSLWEAFESEEPAMFIGDEWDRVPAFVAVATNSAFANGILVTDFGTVEKNPGTVIVLTGNTAGTGATREYGSATRMDSSVKDRMVCVYIDFDRRIEMACANGDERIVNFIHELRRILKLNDNHLVISYRGIEMYTNLLKDGFSLKEALDWGIFKGELTANDLYAAAKLLPRTFTRERNAMIQLTRELCERNKETVFGLPESGAEENDKGGDE